jgi:small-conductance mechanosensitive channel
MSDLEATIQKITEFDWGENNLVSYGVAFALFLLVYYGFSLAIRVYFVKLVSAFVEKTTTQFDDIAIQIIKSIGRPFYAVLGIYSASQALIIPSTLEVWIRTATVLIFTFYTARGFQQLAFYVIKQIITKGKEDEPAPSFLSIIKAGIGVVIWTIAGFYILSSFNINITALVGGLGVTSIAVAFALQNVLSELFASLSIYLDRPFEVGDFIIIGEDKGTVQKIGLKSTKLKSLDGEQLVVSNKELSEIRINNFAKMSHRRIEFQLGVEYDTTSEQLRLIPKIIENIIKNIEICEFDRAHFKSFGDFSLIIEVVYTINNGNFNIYMDIQQKINLEIKDAFEREGIVMAFPTQTLHLFKHESGA